MNGSCSAVSYVAPVCFRLSMVEVLGTLQALGVCLFLSFVPLDMDIFHFLQAQSQGPGCCVGQSARCGKLSKLPLTEHTLWDSIVGKGIIFPIYF